MWFNVIPADVLSHRAVYSRPCCYQRNPCNQQQQLGNVDFLHDILRPLMVMSHNNPRSESCHGRRPRDTHKCQGVTRRGVEKGDCPVQKRQPESMTASLDFHGFSAEEIKVKVTDNAIVVYGQHDDPSNSFRVTRRLPLPPGVDKTGVRCRYVDGKVILEIPDSANHSVEDKPERQEDEKKIEPEEEGKSDPARTSDTGNGEDNCGMEIEKDVQAAFQEGMEQMTGLFSTLFGLPLREKKGKTDLQNGSPDKEEEPAEQTTADEDREEPRPREDNKTADRSFGKQVDVEEEKSEGEKELEDTCLMLKSDEDLIVRDDSDDPTHVDEQTTGDSAALEQTAVRVMNEDEEVASLMSDGEEDARSIQVKVDENLPISSTSQDFEIRLDLSNYKPEDIRVVVRNGDVIVDAERERKYDGYNETETLRRYIHLSDKVDPSMVRCVLNEDGEMTIQAPYLCPTISEKEEKIIPTVWE